MNITNIDDFTNEIIGVKGSAEREIFEYDLRMDILGTIIKDVRVKKHLTQGQLGELLGVQKSQISKLENNTKDFRIGTVIRALEVLGAKVKLSINIENTEQFIML